MHAAVEAERRPRGHAENSAARVRAAAIEVQDGLDVGRAASELTNAATLWVGDEATMYEGGRALPSPRVAAIRATPPTDRSFESYDQALELVSGPPPADTDEISVKEGFLDVLFEYPIESAASRFSINSRWSRLGIRTLTLIRLVLPDGGVRTFQLHRDPGLLRLDPAWYQAAWQFVRMGFAHPFDRTNDLLFLLCLAIPLRRVRNAVVVVLAFTLAYSLTLLASTGASKSDAALPAVEVACTMLMTRALFSSEPFVSSY